MSENVLLSKITPRQRLALTSLLTGSNETEAAAAARITPRTLRRWLRMSHFREELTAAGREASRRQVDQTMTRLTGGQQKALDTLENIMNSPTAKNADKRQAAVSWLTVWMGIAELNISERLTALEEEDQKMSIQSRLAKLEAKIAVSDRAEWAERLEDGNYRVAYMGGRRVIVSSLDNLPPQDLPIKLYIGCSPDMWDSEQDETRASILAKLDRIAETEANP